MVGGLSPLKETLSTSMFTLYIGAHANRDKPNIENSLKSIATQIGCCRRLIAFIDSFLLSKIGFAY